MVTMDGVVVLYIVFCSYVICLAFVWAVVVIVYIPNYSSGSKQGCADGIPANCQTHSNLASCGADATDQQQDCGEQAESLDPPPGDEHLEEVRHLGPVNFEIQRPSSSHASAPALLFDGMVPEDGDGPITPVKGSAPGSSHVVVCGKMKEVHSPWQHDDDVSEFNCRVEPLQSSRAVLWGSRPKPCTTLINLDTGQMQADDERSCPPRSERRSDCCHGCLVCGAEQCFCCGDDWP